MRQVLIVIDMQNDFITGVLGTKEAVRAVPNVVDIINSKKWDKVYATHDTHYDNYKDTMEGKYLPVPHCIKNTRGWEIESDVLTAIAAQTHEFVDKETFCSLELPSKLQLDGFSDGECEITLCGVCTDICVVSNALNLKANMPNTVIKVVKFACAGVTPEKHEAAINVMSSCQIEIIV